MKRWSLWSALLVAGVALPVSVLVGCSPAEAGPDGTEARMTGTAEGSPKAGMPAIPAPEGSPAPSDVPEEDQAGIETEGANTAEAGSAPAPETPDVAAPGS
jgi:hypothetical protein